MTRERDNLLSLIAVLATLNYGKDEMEKPHALAKQIVQDATNKGLELSIAERALGDKLKEAATFVETKAKK